MPGRCEVRPEKEQAVKETKNIADKSSCMIVTGYKGMTVKQITDLRRAVRPSGAQYKVIRNSVSNRALPKIDKLQEQIAGPVAVLFAGDDMVEPVKQLIEFIKEFEKPKILGGVLENEYIDEKGVKALSKLPSKEELLAKMLQCMNGPTYGFVNVLAGILRKLVYALNAVKEHKSTSAQEQKEEEKPEEKKEEIKKD